MTDKEVARNIIEIIDAYESCDSNAIEAIEKYCHQVIEKQETEEELPEHGFIETIYRRGKNPHWNIGDTLAYYEFYSDCEGEIVLGKVTNVELDEENDDWIYTFGDGDKCDEQLLLNDETYKKN